MTLHIKRSVRETHLTLSLRVTVRYLLHTERSGSAHEYLSMLAVQCDSYFLPWLQHLGLISLQRCWT